MKILTKIQELAADSQTNIGDLLRQCRILASRMSTPAFEEWVDRELDGYPKSEEQLPDYRIVTSYAYGHFIGDFGLQRTDVPIPSLALKAQHRHWAETVNLREPIAVFADLVSAPDHHEFTREWPANLVLVYQAHFFEGAFVLHKAWQSVSRGVLLGIIETVRNRVLRFALELQKTLPNIDESPESLPTAQRETALHMFQTIVYGNVGNVTTGGTNVNQTATIIPGDPDTLRRALAGLGIEKSDIAELETALKDDGIATDGRLGSRTSRWLGQLCEKAASGVGQVAISTAGNIVPKLIMQYLGFGLPQ
ncbi:MAG TPA: hypothetical protein VE422_46575 [Terriglobia bacterium]|nr:hypothetical protein [Terriglobia bacterium]